MHSDSHGTSLVRSRAWRKKIFLSNLLKVLLVCPPPSAGLHLVDKDLFTCETAKMVKSAPPRVTFGGRNGRSKNNSKSHEQRKGSERTGQWHEHLGHWPPDCRVLLMSLSVLARWKPKPCWSLHTVLLLYLPVYTVIWVSPQNLSYIKPLYP